MRNISFTFEAVSLSQLPYTTNFVNQSSAMAQNQFALNMGTLSVLTDLSDLSEDEEVQVPAPTALKYLCTFTLIYLPLESR